jgi:purine-binding chemotaxis protein CheW
VEEIVKRDAITRVPNTPNHVEGVVDLRGQITTILNPKYLLDIDADGEESLLVVFDPEDFEDQGAIGWVVDGVRQVVPIVESEINKPPVEEAYIEGVVDREGEGEDEADSEFVIWVDPETAIEQAAGTDGDEDN